MAAEQKHRGRHQQRQASLPALRAWSPPSHARHCAHESTARHGVRPSARIRAATVRVLAVSASGEFSPSMSSLNVLSAVASSRGQQTGPSPLHSSYAARHLSQHVTHPLVSPTRPPARSDEQLQRRSLPTRCFEPHCEPTVPETLACTAPSTRGRFSKRATPTARSVAATTDLHVQSGHAAAAEGGAAVVSTSTAQQKHLLPSVHPLPVAAHAATTAESAKMSANPAESWVSEQNALCEHLQSNGLACSAIPPASLTRPSVSFSPPVTWRSTSVTSMPAHSSNSRLPHIPPDHPAMTSRANRNSIFYRRPRPSPPPDTHSSSSLSDSDSIPTNSSCENISMHNAGYEPGSDGEDGTDTAASEEAEFELRYALCQVLPYWNCYHTRDTHEFLWTTSPAIENRPVTIKEDPVTFGVDPSNYYPPTPEIVMTMVEYLRIAYRSDICLAVVPFQRRLPEIRDFIWRLFDGTKVDMWTGMACLLMLRRFCQEQPPCDDAPYEAPYSLFLGAFMLASEQCVRTDHPELFTLESISRILDTWYQPADLARIRLETLVQTNYRCWISKADITNHAEHNMYDIHNIRSSRLYFEERQRMRMIVEQENRRLEEDLKRLLARLDRYMYRTPHDSVGSWNTNTMYCTETRFLFRHLPWYPGAVTPIHITARNEQARFYSSDHKRNPVFSPLLPALRSRVSSSTN
ncbi:hypothetical protein IW142_000720 [Coemansia sp. RSA 564]|nr:hypothetical protein IW142_000720 [Coemansia sp. RSA 564]